MEVFECPRCKKEVNCHSALSRRDNKTKICSACGTEEAIFDFKIYCKEFNHPELAEEIKHEKEVEKSWLITPEWIKEMLKKEVE